MKRWSGRWCRCWPTWSAQASPSIPICCAGCPTISRKAQAALEKRNPQAGGRGTSTSARPSSWAISCSANSSCQAARSTKTGAWSTDADVLEDVAAQGHDDRQEGARLAPACQAARHLYRCAARLYQSARPAACTPPMRWRRPRPGGSPPPIPICRIFPIRTEEGRRIRQAFIARQGLKADQRRLQPDRAAAAGPYRRHPAAEKSLCRRSRHSRHDGVGNFRRAGQGHAGGNAPPRQGDQFRHRLRHFRLSASPISSASRAARPTTTSRNISSASPASATIWKRPRHFAREHGYVETLFGRRIHIREINRPIRAFAAGPSAPRSMRRSRARPPTSSAAP